MRQEKTMTKEPVVTESYVKAIRWELSFHDLKQILLSRTCQEAKIENLILDGHGKLKNGYSVSVIFDDEAEGSPPHKTGTKAVVNIVENKLYGEDEL